MKRDVIAAPFWDDELPEADPFADPEAPLEWQLCGASKRLRVVARTLAPIEAEDLAEEVRALAAARSLKVSVYARVRTIHDVTLIAAGDTTAEDLIRLAISADCELFGAMQPEEGQGQEAAPAGCDRAQWVHEALLSSAVALQHIVHRRGAEPVAVLELALSELGQFFRGIGRQVGRLRVGMCPETLTAEDWKALEGGEPLPSLKRVTAATDRLLLRLAGLLASLEAGGTTGASSPEHLEQRANSIFLAFYPSPQQPPSEGDNVHSC